MSLTAAHQAKMRRYLDANGYLNVPQVKILFGELNRLRLVRDMFHDRLDLLREHLGHEEFMRIVSRNDDTATWGNDG